MFVFSVFALEVAQGKFPREGSAAQTLVVSLSMCSVRGACVCFLSPNLESPFYFDKSFPVFSLLECIVARLVDSYTGFACTIPHVGTPYCLLATRPPLRVRSPTAARIPPRCNLYCCPCPRVSSLLLNPAAPHSCQPALLSMRLTQFLLLVQFVH